MDKLSRYIFHLWGSLLISHAQPLPHSTNNDECVYPEFFPSFNFVQDGERGDCKIFLKSWTVICCCCCCCKNTQTLSKKVRTTASLSQGFLSRIIVISKLSPLKKVGFYFKKTLSCCFASLFCISANVFLTFISSRSMASLIC